MTTTAYRTISNDNEQFFTGRGLMQAVGTAKREISTSIISSPPPRRSWRSLLPSKSPFSRLSLIVFDAPFVYEEVDNVEVPVVLDSLETYEFVGFTQHRAAELWERFQKYGDAVGGDFLDFAIRHVESPEFPDATSGLDDWAGLMTQLEINDHLKTAILLPQSDDIRYTHTCKYWVIDSIKVAYDTLKGLNNKLEARRMKLLGHPGRRRSFKPPSLPPTPRRHNDFEYIWKAAHVQQCENFYDPEAQRMNLAAVSSVPGDFSGTNALPYFNLDEDTADRYAVWLKHRVPLADVVIIEVAVPEALLMAHYITCLQYQDDDYKELVWTSRRGQALPSSLDDLKDTDILIGEIASSKNSKYERMTSFTEMKPSDLVGSAIHGEERILSQWVPNTAEFRRAFEEECRDKVWIHRVGTKIVPKGE